MKAYMLYVGMTDREIQAALAKRGVRGIEARMIRDQVAEYKAKMRAMSARKRMAQDLWRSLMTPLSNEQRTVRGMLRYESQRYPNPERREALNAYAETLDKLRRRLRDYRYDGRMTPRELAEYMKKEKGKTIPNNGEHWTDWVPEKVKRALIDAFMAIPRAAKARVKDPFPRTMTKADNIKLRKTHLATAKRELLEAQQELSMIRELNRNEPSEAERDAQARVKHVQNIVNWLICLEDNELVPRTWGELNVAELPIVELPAMQEQ